MPVVVRHLTNHFGIGLFADLPTELGGTFDGETTMMGAVGQISRKHSAGVGTHEMSFDTAIVIPV